MVLTKRILLVLILFVSFTFKANSYNSFEIEFSGFNFFVSEGYVLKSGLYFNDNRLEFVKGGSVGGISTIASRIVVASNQSCGELCQNDFTHNELWSVKKECSRGSLKARDLEMNLNGFKARAGVIFTKDNSLFIYDNSDLFNYWFKEICQ